MRNELHSHIEQDNENCVLLLSEQDIITYITSADSKKFFHKPKTKIIGLSFIKLLNQYKSDTKILEKVLKLKKSWHGFIDIELQEKKIFKISLINIKNDKNHPEHWIVILMVRNTAFQELKSYMNAIINNLPGAVYWKDKQGRYLGCNRIVAEMAGFKNPEELIGKTDYDLCWSEFAPEWQALDNRVLQENQTIVREERAKLADSQIITELTYKTPLKNELNEIVGIIGTSLDITDRKKMEAELHYSQQVAEAANQAKSEFIRNMEHQLRTPFSGVYSIVQMLFEEETNPEKKNLLEITYQSAQEFLELLNNIIDFSRNQWDSTEILAKKFDLKMTIERVVRMELAAAQAKNLSLTFDYASELPVIFIGDPHRIQRLLLNLIGNAIRFTNQGGACIKVQLAKQIDEKHFIIKIIVADTGIGIAEEKQRYIYEKFYRLHPANQNKYKGAGLGLYIVKQIINDLEGEIDVNSYANKGTTFTCTLPFKRPLLDEVSPSNQ